MESTAGKLWRVWMLSYIDKYALKLYLRVSKNMINKTNFSYLLTEQKNNFEITVLYFEI